LRKSLGQPTSAAARRTSQPIAVDSPEHLWRRAHSQRNSKDQRLSNHIRRIRRRVRHTKQRGRNPVSLLQFSRWSCYDRCTRLAVDDSAGIHRRRRGVTGLHTTNGSSANRAEQATDRISSQVGSRRQSPGIRGLPGSTMTSSSARPWRSIDDGNVYFGGLKPIKSSHPTHRIFSGLAATPRTSSKNFPGGVDALYSASERSLIRITASSSIQSGSGAHAAGPKVLRECHHGPALKPLRRTGNL